MKAIILAASRKRIWLLVLFAAIATSLALPAQSEDADPPKRQPFLKSKKATPEPSPAKNKKRKNTPMPSPSPGKAGKKRSPTPSPTPKPKRSPSPHSSPTATARPSPTPEESATPRAEKSPKPSTPPASATAGKQSAAPTPSATPAASASGVEEPAQVVIEKSGFEEEQGYEPPPTPPPRRFFLWRLFSRREPSYQFVTGSVRREIDRAPVLRRRWQFIIVHNSGTRQGNARVFDYYHRNVRRMVNGMAYHFVIGNGTSSGDGQIEVGDRWRRQIQGGHVHSDYLNSISLGICLVGDFNRGQPTPAQLASAEELISYLRQRCGKVDRRYPPVRPHREMNPPRWATDCPGDDFPYGWFNRFRD